jgi:hypothetical protein
MLMAENTLHPDPDPIDKGQGMVQCPTINTFPGTIMYDGEIIVCFS